MANTRISNEIRELCMRLMNEGHTAKEVRQIVWDMGYETPSAMTISNWFRNHKGPKRDKLRQYKKGNPFMFTPSAKVAGWIAAQSDKNQAVNTIIEWYLLQVKLEEKRVKERERYQRNKELKSNQQKSEQKTN